jgi:hypothetical protein
LSLAWSKSFTSETLGFSEAILTAGLSRRLDSTMLFLQVRKGSVLPSGYFIETSAYEATSGLLVIYGQTPGCYCHI